MLKDKGTLTLKVYDILNQNNNSQRTASGNFIQDSESTVLQRFVMLSFSYKFNSLGKKEKQVMEGCSFLIRTCTNCGYQPPEAPPPPKLPPPKPPPKPPPPKLPPPPNPPEPLEKLPRPRLLRIMASKRLSEPDLRPPDRPPPPPLDLETAMIMITKITNNKKEYFCREVVRITALSRSLIGSCKYLKDSVCSSI